MRRTSKRTAAASPDETQERTTERPQAEDGREEIDNMRLSEHTLNASPSADETGRNSTRSSQSLVNELRTRLRAARARKASRRRVSPVSRAVPVVTWLLMFALVFQPTLVLAGTISAKEQGTFPAISSFARWPNFTNAYTGFTNGAQSALNYVSSLFAASEEAAPVEMNAAPSALAVPTPTPDNSVKDAAISRQTPNINSGRIQGSMRVFEGKSYSLNHAFTLTGDLYNVGTPNLIRTNGGSTYGGTVNDGGASAPSGYGITLNHRTSVAGKIHTRANAIPLPADIPASVPAPAGTRTVNLSTPADVANIGAWNTVQDLNISAAGLVVNVPPGNYRRFNVSAASRLNFTAGVYNFSDTLFLNNSGASTQATGAVIINIAQTFNLDGAKMLLGTNTLSGDVRVNVLGASVDLQHGADMSGLLRAVNARVHLNHASIVRGQVIANVLHMNNDSQILGNTAFTPPPDTQSPTVAITSPVNNATTIEASINVSGTATDAGENASGIDKVFLNDTLVAFNAANGTWTLSNVALVVGSNTLTARAVDKAGNSSPPQSITITRQTPTDGDAPLLAITSPADNATTQAASVTVTGTVSDPQPYPSGVQSVTVNGAPATIDAANGTWTISNVQLDNIGPNAINARAVDNAGNVSTKSINVNRQQPPDTLAPLISISAPADSTTTTETAVQVSGTASDVGANASGVAHVYVNNTEVPYNPQTGAWATTAPVALQLGANTITARAVDGAGHPSSVTVTITRQEPPDTAAPVVAITSPADGHITEEETLTVSGTVSDTGVNTSGVRSVSVNGAPATLDAQAGTWTINISLSMGANPINARATDNAGNPSQPVTISVTRQPSPDRQGPTLTITAPANDSATTSETITVTGTATDIGANPSGVAHVYVNDAEATLDPALGTWTISGVALNIIGPNAINARAIDNAGNVSTQSISVTRNPPPDTTKPNLFISSPEDGLTTQDETIAITGTVNDPGQYASGVARVTVNGTPAVLDAQAGTWTLTGFPLIIGSNPVTVHAFDNANNDATLNITINRIPPPDTLAPVVAITAPADNFISPDATVNVTGTANDEGPYPTGVRRVTVNGQPAAYNAATHQWTASGVQLDEGANVIRVVAEDGAPTPNRGEAVINVTRRTPDTAPPTIVINAPQTPLETYDGTVNVNGTATDEGLNAAGVAGVTVNGREAAFDAATGEWSLSNLPLVYGDNTIVAVAIDKSPAQNRGSAEIHVTRNRIPAPQLTLTNPQNGAVLAATSITVAGLVASLSKEPLTVTVNNEAASISGGQFTKTVTLNEGANTFNVVVTDSLGQQAQSSCTVVRDLTPPAVSFVNVPATIQPGGTYPIQVEATDNIGVGDVEFRVDGQRVGISSTAPYQFTLEVSSALAAGNTLVLTAIARDLSGTSAVATAQTRTSGPGGISGYAFDDATGYVLEGVRTALDSQAPVMTDATGAFSLISSVPTGVVRLSKDGYTPIERLYTVTAGEGTALFDARLTPFDAQANQINSTGGTARGDGGRLQVAFAAGAFAQERDVRVTSVSPQGLANLLPYGWSPVPGAIVDVRAVEGAANAFASPAQLRVMQVQGLAQSIPLVLARYDETTHGWMVVAVGLNAGASGALEAELPAAGQYAFLVADTGAHAPPAPVAGQPLTSSRPADSALLDAATATAVATPRTANYSAAARSSINFVATAPSQLPSGVAIEATFNDTYKLLAGKESLLVDRPAQDFVLYSYPAASVEQPNRLAAFFVAKPTRTEFSIAELLSANVHVEIRSGRQTKTGVLVGAGGGTLRASNGAQLTIPPNALQGAQPIFFNDIQTEFAGAQLPNGYEIVAAFDVDLTNTTLGGAGSISTPAVAGDMSRIVVARLVTVGGQRAPKVVARAVEDNGRLVSSVAAPAVPSGVALSGITSSGRYVFIRVPQAFGYLKGTVTEGGPAPTVRVSADQTPFVDVTGADGKFVLVGAAGADVTGTNQIGAASLTSDATGRATSLLGAQDSVSDSQISLTTQPLAVESVSPVSGAQNMIVTTPVTVTFNKPVSASSLTGSSFTLTTASGNPVLGQITVLAGNRVAVITPSTTLAGSTAFKVTVTSAVRDIYGKPLASPFVSTFTTSGVVKVDDRLKPEKIKINYPDADGICRILIPAGAIPEGSTIVAVNNVSGSTASTVAGTTGVQLNIQAQVGDEITLIIRQPDGVEYRVSQGAYRRSDGFTSVGSAGGALTSDDGEIVLDIPAGAVSGQADIKLAPRAESEITAPRVGDMAPEGVAFGGGVTIRAEGSFQLKEELHLELPATGNVTEGQRVAFMRPNRITTETGEQRDVWEPVTSGKVEDGKFKTTSPPFIGLWFYPGIWDVYVFIPRFMRAVHGTVTERVPGGAPKPIAGAQVAITQRVGQVVTISTTSSATGGFSTFEFYFSTNDPVEVRATVGGRTQVAIASPFYNTDPFNFLGLAGLSSMYANVIFPPESDSGPERKPALLQITGSRADVEQGETDSLVESGFVPVGKTVAIVVKTFPAVSAQGFKGRLLIGGTEGPRLTWEQMEGSGAAPGTGSSTFGTAFQVTAEGNYTVEIETFTTPNVAVSKATAEYSFISLTNPNNRPPLEGAPKVISVTPADDATQVEVGSKIHLEFSEPVKNLVAGTTVFVRDEAAGTQIGGKITSGGVAVGADEANISVIDFEPEPALEGGKTYTVNVTSGVVDTESDALEPAFSSTFKTFTGVVLTPNNTMPDSAYRVASAGQYAATVFNDNIGGSLLTVYDMSNPQVPTIAHKGFISQRAIAITMAENQDDTFKGGAERDGYSRIAIITTHALPDISRAMNLWIYNLDDPSAPEVIGVVSLSFPNRTTSVPGYVTIHGKRAYVGTMSQGGLVVVDIEQALSQWAAAVRFSPNFSLQHPKVKAVQPDKGFGMESKLQSIPINIGPQNNGNPSPITSVSVIDQMVQSVPFGDDPIRMPVAYVSTPIKPEIYVLGTHEQKDGQNGWAGSDGGGLDFRVLAHKPVLPVGNVLEVRAVSGITFREPAAGSVPSHIRTGDLAVALGATRLWFFDVTTPTDIKQLPSHAFSDLGVNAGYAKRMDVEGTIAYIIFTDKIVAIDFKNPRQPVHLATVSNVGDDLRWVSVHEGFIYSLSNGTGGRNGLNVSIASAVSQVLTYGVNTSEPDKVCANPVVIDRQTKVMAQPAGIFFQIYGRDLPRSVEVTIAREKMVNDSMTRETITTIPATIQQAENPGEAGSSQSVMIGHAQWTTTTPIDRSWQYTAEVVLDGEAQTEFRSREEPIAFSFLISEAQSSFYAPKGETGFYSYMLGNSASVELTVNGESVFGNPDPQKPNQPQDPTDPHTRSYGLNVDRVFHNLPEGKYTFLLKATLEGNDQVTDELEGEMDVTGTAPDMRSPGNVVINNVELSNGNLALTYADAEIKNRGLSLSVLRSYNKDRANHFNPFGYGWNHNYQMLLTHNDSESDKSWALVGGDGTGQKFLESKLNDGEVPAEDPHQGKLVKNSDGSFDYYTKAYVKHHFPGALEIASSGFYNSSYMGNLSYIEEPNGNRITLTYDSNGRMTRATDSSNRSLNYSYELAETPLVGVMSPSSNNVISCTNKSQFNIVRKRFLKAQIGKAWRIKEITGPGGLKLEYEYDADGNLERATRVGQDSVSVTTGDSIWKYEYNPTAPEGSGVPTVHLLKSVTNPNDSGDGKHKTSYEYQFQQRRSFVQSINMPEGISNTFTNTLDGSKISQTVVKDGNQNSTTYAFDRQNRTTTVTGPRGDTTVLVFNSKGQQESITDAEGMKTSIGYDLNNPASTTISGGGESTGTLTRYNAKFGKLEHFEDGNGNVTEYTLDGKGNVQLITLPTGGQIVFDYNSNGDILSIVDEHNLTTSYVYDAYGNPTVVTRETQPGGETVVTRNTYDVRSRLKTTTDTLAPNVSNTYDALDHLSQVDTSDPTGIRASQTASYTHSAGGQILTHTLSGGDQTQSTNFTYDDLDRLLRKDETISGTGGFTLRYSYDDNSNLTSESDRRGVTKTYAYDASNFWTRTTLSGPFGDNVIISQATDVDKVGNPRGITDHYGQTVGLTFDGLHRLRVKALPGGYTETSDYDPNGNIVSTKDRNNRETKMTYDGLNRIKSQQDPAGRISTWTYDDATHKTTIVMSPQGLTRSIQLDGMQRPLREEVKFGNAAYTTSYTYTGRSVEITDPRGTVSLKTLSAFGDAGDISVLGTSPAWSNELRYTAFGGVISRKDANGRMTTYTVDGLNRATAINHPGGFSESFSYDGEGNILSHRDRRGTLTEMTYDNLARPLTTKVHDTSGVIPVSTITYDDGSHSESITDARQHTTLHVYDALHRLKSITNADRKTKSFVFDGMNLREETDFKQATTSYTYDEVDRIKEIKDRNGKVTNINYTDADGTRREVTDRRGNKRVEMFDALGRVVSVNDGGQLLYALEYDGNNNRKLLVDGRGNRINYDYDPLNRLETVNHSSVQTETYVYDGVGNVVSYSNGFGNPVTQTFDALDHLASRTDGASNTTTYKYDPEGLLVRKTDPKGGRHTTNYEYNAFGSLTKVTDAAQGIWQYEYFPDQTVKSVRDANGHTVEYDYDAVMRPTTVTQHGSTNLVTSYGYDANGNRTSVVDPKNQRTNIEYDALDRAKSIQYANAAGAGPRQQNLQYDPEGNLTAINETAHNGLAVVSRSYARTFDARNRLTSSTDPYNRRVSYGYDAANNVTSVRDASERETGYDYDSLNRLSGARLPGGASVGYTWKPNGLLESVRYASGMERNYRYDGGSRLTSVVNTLGQNQSEEYAYTYDGNNNRTKETRKFGGSTFRTVNYNYDDLDRLTEADYSDENSRGLRGEYYANPDFTELKLERLDPNVDFKWTDGTSPASNVGADNFSVRWTGQVKALHSQGYTFSVVSDEGVRLWVNDQLIIDNWTSHTTTEDSGVIALDAGQKYNIRLEFREGTGDAEVRLMWQSASQEKQIIPRSQLTPPTPKLKYEYDAVGNRTRESGRDGNDRPINYSYQYDAANRMTNARGYVGGDIAYDYDGNGNLIAAQQGGQTARYEYDARDQLRRVVNFSQQEVARYDYDYERRRLGKTVGGVENSFVYSGDQLIGEYGAGGLQTNRYDYGHDLVRSDLKGEGERWHFSDALGSVTALSGVDNGVAAVAARYEYGAWGNVMGGGGSLNQFGYTGQRLDGETGLMPLGNGERYYSSTLGRFIQQDSFTGLMNTPATLNRYAYVNSNPIIHTDPSGHVAPAVVAAAVLLALGIASKGITYATHYYDAETRRHQAGLSEDEAASSYWLAAKDTVGYTGLKRAWTGRDPYTGRHLGGKERAWEGVLGALDAIDTVVLVVGVVRAASAGLRATVGALSGASEVAGGARTAVTALERSAQAVRALESAKGLIAPGISSVARLGRTAALAERVSESWRGARSVLRGAKDEIASVAQDFRMGWRARPRGTYLGSGGGGLQDAYEGIESGVRSARRGSNARRAASEVDEAAVAVQPGGQRPGGYKTLDVNSHGQLSPQKNRAAGHLNTREDGLVQSHHIIQDAWAQQNVVGYSRNKAAAILIRSLSGEAHAFITASQTARRLDRIAQGLTPFGGPPIRQQFMHSYRDLIDAGVPLSAARRAIRRAYKDFDELGAFSQ